jgi:hypothetical protein
VLVVPATGLNAPLGVIVPITPGSRVATFCSAAPAGAIEPTATGRTRRAPMLRARKLLVTVRDGLRSEVGLGNCGSRSLSGGDGNRWICEPVVHRIRVVSRCTDGQPVGRGHVTRWEEHKVAVRAS